MQQNNWPQISVLATAAIFGVKPNELDVIHITIIFASIVGAMWALNRQPQKTPFKNTFFFIRIALTASVLAVAASRLIAGFLPGNVNPDGLMPLIAFFIGLVGDDWPNAYKWITSIFKKKVQEKVGEDRE